MCCAYIYYKPYGCLHALLLAPLQITTSSYLPQALFTSSSPHDKSHAAKSKSKHTPFIAANMKLRIVRNVRLYRLCTSSLRRCRFPLWLTFVHVHILTLVWLKKDSWHIVGRPTHGCARTEVCYEVHFATN